MLKNFNFPLEKVLNYKNQILDSLQSELQMIQNELNESEKKLSELHSLYKATNLKLREACLNHITANEISSYKLYLNETDKLIKINEEISARIKQKLTKKQIEIVNAKIEVSTFEKLKEKQFTLYSEALKKENELFIEEFVSNCR